MDRLLLQAIKEYCEVVMKSSASTVQFEEVGGGSINQTYRLIFNENNHFFCKINSATAFPGLFESEKNSLELLAKNGSIRVPEVYGILESGGHQVLVMEWIEPGIRNESFWKKFGTQLANLHSATASAYGLAENNYMGALRQDNGFQKDWVQFFIYSRLQPQIQLALKAGLLTARDETAFENLYKKLDNIFPLTKPALVHGDLWSGNFLCDTTSNPVLIDPAVYYGIPGVDLAMTTLFGGFDKTFYQAYRAVMPFPKNYEEQWEICNLYPLLIHLNLFGSSYHSAISRVIKKF